MIENIDIAIGIDPDIEKSGLAILDVQSRKMQLFSIKFDEIISKCAIIHQSIKMSGKQLKIYVEAGYLNESNWHLKPFFSKSMCCEIGRRTGENHGTAKNIVCMLRSFGCYVEEVKPLKKCWKGKDGKITAEEFNSVTGYGKRSNQETRDAGLIAWCCAGIPVRLSVRNKK